MPYGALTRCREATRLFVRAMACLVLDNRAAHFADEAADAGGLTSLPDNTAEWGTMRGHGWLVSYGLIGLTQSGLAPILMPLVAAGGGAAGLTYAAFSLLGLFAPVLGSWADRTGRHRDLLIWGSVGAGVLLLPFGAVSELAAHRPGCRRRVGRHGNDDGRQCARDPGICGG